MYRDVEKPIRTHSTYRGARGCIAMDIGVREPKQYIGCIGAYRDVYHCNTDV